MSGVIPVRPGEDFNRELLAEALSVACPASGTGTLRVSEFGSGASNLTYLLERNEWQGVLRRPPQGTLPPKAHDMAREYSWLKSLCKIFPLAPEPYWLCTDLRILGVVFYVMEYRPGFVMNEVMPPLAESSVWGEPISKAFVDTLVTLHGLDWEAHGMGVFGHPVGFLSRQVSSWIERYQGSSANHVPAAQYLMRWLTQRVPESAATTVIHNDFKLNNLVVAPGAPDHIRAVVDWEMATVGDPLLDLAVALSYWTEPRDPLELQDVLPTVTVLPGFWTRRRLAIAYSQQSGRRLDDLPFYFVFAYFKLAVILQQIYRRYARGQTRDPRFEHFNRGVAFLIEYAASLTGQGEIV